MPYFFRNRGDLLYTLISNLKLYYLSYIYGRKKGPNNQMKFSYLANTGYVTLSGE